MIEFFNHQVVVNAYCDSRAAGGIERRSGVGKMKPVDMRVQWVQEVMAPGIAPLGKREREQGRSWHEPPCKDHD